MSMSSCRLSVMQMKPSSTHVICTPLRQHPQNQGSGCVPLCSAVDHTPFQVYGRYVSHLMSPFPFPKTAGKSPEREQKDFLKRIAAAYEHPSSSFATHVLFSIHRLGCNIVFFSHPGQITVFPGQTDTQTHRQTSRKAEADRRQTGRQGLI